MAARILQQGIDAVRGGHLEEGSRLLRIALRDENLPPHLRATALMWLAQTTAQHAEQVEYYRLAVQADPANEAAQQGLSALLAPQPPGTNNNPPSSSGGSSWSANNETPRTTGDTGPLPRQSGYTQPNDPRQPPSTPPGYNPQGNFDRFDPRQPNRPQQTGYDAFSQQNPRENPQRDFGGSQQRDDSFDFNRSYNSRDQRRDERFDYGGGFESDNSRRPPSGDQFGSIPFGSQDPAPRNPFDSNPFNTGGSAQPERPPDRRNADPFGQQPEPYNFDSFRTEQSGIGGFDSFSAPPSQPSNDSFAGLGERDQGPITLEEMQRTVGVVGGPNGPGTGFFVARNGLIATTRHVVGGEEQVEIRLANGQRLVGQVARSFPHLDLAFVQANVRLQRLMPVSQTPSVPDNTPLVAVAHPNQGLRSSKRATRQAMDPHWFPTLINHLRDAGGNPIFAQGNENVLVGMLTKNLSRSNGYMYALHITKIYEMLQQYARELQQQGQGAYCFACGTVSRAPQFGGFYCERCGNTLSYAINMTRYPQPNLVGLYGENANRPCPSCDSTVGFHKGLCLRCGYQLR